MSDVGGLEETVLVVENFAEEYDSEARGLCDLLHLYRAYPLSSLLSLSSHVEPVLHNAAFSSLFDTVDSTWEFAWHASQQALGDGADDGSLGYGEILPKSVFSIISQLKLFGLVSSCILYDFGSGSGRLLFAASLAHNFRHCVGIEVVEALHQNALANMKRWKDHELPYIWKVMFEFRLDDITTVELSPHPNVIFCHATLFDKCFIQLRPATLRRLCRQYVLRDGHSIPSNWSQDQNTITEKVRDDLGSCHSLTFSSR